LRRKTSHLYYWRKYVKSRRIQRSHHIYDANICIDMLIEEGMSDEEAIEYFDNVGGAYVGGSTPIWMYPYEL
jgi:hypothetical protein